MLRCPVRDCRKCLLREAHRAVCPQGHSFDIARSGYLNLLQPQERRSRLPGDSKAAVLGRRHLYDRGVGTPFLKAINELLGPAAGDHLLDVGCGEGFYGGSLAQQTGCHTHGIDISTMAIDEAARRYKECEWIVGNADRFVPYEDNVFKQVLSVTARMNAPEFRRVLHANGTLLVAVPAANDLIEFRGIGRDRAEQTKEVFATDFIEMNRHRVTHRMHLESESVLDLLRSIYRPRPKEEMGVHAQTVTFSLDLLLFRPR